MTRSRDERVVGEWLYRVLLFAYPRRFRARCADEMVAFYRERIRGESTRSARGARRFVAVWMQVIPDLAASALAERFSWLHRESDPAPSIVRTFSRRREDSMSILMQDIRYALRGIRQRPGFAAVVLTTLALGIGANAAIFTVVNAVLLRPLPFAQSERIVDFTHQAPYGQVSEAEFVDYHRGLTAFAGLAAYSRPTATLTAGDEPLRVESARVSADFFRVLGVAPEIGRVFASDEFAPSSRARGIVISHALWEQQFGANPQVVGQTTQVGGAPATIIGVMPAGFDFPSAETSFWSAWRLNIDSLQTRNNHYMHLVGRLATGATLDGVRSQTRTLDAQWMRDFPETYAGGNSLVATITPLPDYLLGPTRPYLLALLGAVGFILLIACVNVANLLLVRGESRRKELAIRTALGASASRVARQVLTESMIFALLGASLGIVLAFVGVRALVAVAPSDLPRLAEIGVDARVVAFTAAITIATGALFGLAPALRVARGDTADVLREGGKTSGQGGSAVVRRSLVIAEVALAVVMLSGAGLLIRSLVKLQQIELGFDRSRLLTVELALPAHKYTDTTADEFFRELIARARSVPGVTAAAVVSALPITGDDNGWSIMIDGRVLRTVGESPSARPEAVTPGYFTAMKIRLLRGRNLTEQDRMGAPPVVVISDGMAKQLWPGMDPIGRTLRMFASTGPWVMIVGVVADVRELGFQKSVPPTMYFPYSQATEGMYYTPQRMTLVLRTSGSPSGMTTTTRALVRAMDTGVAISHVAPMDRVVGDSIASRTFTTALLAGLAGLALALAGVGIYGVIAYGVSQRTFEIGVRVALGATAAMILRLVMREGAAMTLTGLAVGSVAAMLVDRMLNSLLVGVSAIDLVTLVGTAALLALVAACACAWPARRAARVSPTEALRDG